MKIGIFGGTFNPIHNGHINLALYFKKRLNLDKIIFIPTSVPPHKESKNLLSDYHRLNMVNLAIKNYGFFMSSDIEINRKGKSYTYDTLCQLKEIYPDDNLYLIVGSDMFLSFDKWYNWQAILNLATLCTAYREKNDNSSEMRKYAENCLNLKNDEYYLGEFTPIIISSTEIRIKIKNKENVSSLINSDVEKYIFEKGLYRD